MKNQLLTTWMMMNLKLSMRMRCTVIVKDSSNLLKTWLKESLKENPIKAIKMAILLQVNLTMNTAILARKWFKVLKLTLCNKRKESNKIFLLMMKSKLMLMMKKT